MNEAHFKEIEKVLLYVSSARDRAQRTRQALAKSDAEAHLVEALSRADDALEGVHRTLMQETYFAVPEGERLAV